MIVKLFPVSHAGLWGRVSLELPEFIRKAGEPGDTVAGLVGNQPPFSVLDTRDAGPLENRDATGRKSLDMMGRLIPSADRRTWRQAVQTPSGREGGWCPWTNS